MKSFTKIFLMIFTIASFAFSQNAELISQQITIENAIKSKYCSKDAAEELQDLIKDPVLVKFVFENKKYDLEQTVAIVKRIKGWQKG